MTNKKYSYSEIFYSIQGEGMYTGVPTAWLRFFLCNLQCNGFGQVDPTDSSSFKLPYKEFDATSVTKLEDLPVWKYGCDSSYSWSKKFKHLQHNKTASEICDAIQESMKTGTNPEGLFRHPHSGQEQHMCFTGGEPLMKHGQEAFIEIIKEMYFRDNMPKFITFETNGTQALSDEFINFCNEFLHDTEIFFSVSPKLFTVSGELPKKAIKPEVVFGYQNNIQRSKGQLKPVVGMDDKMWVELENIINQFREQGVTWPVWIMPVGATEEAQHGTLGEYASAGEVATKAFRRGYNVSARVHCYLWNNKIGV